MNRTKLNRNDARALKKHYDMIPDHPPVFTSTPFFKEFEEKFGKKPADFVDVEVVNGFAVINGARVKVFSTDYYSRPTPSRTVIRVYKDNATYKRELMQWMEIYKEHSGPYMQRYNAWFQEQLHIRMAAAERYKQLKQELA